MWPAASFWCQYFWYLVCIYFSYVKPFMRLSIRLRMRKRRRRKWLSQGNIFTSCLLTDCFLILSPTGALGRGGRMKREDRRLWRKQEVSPLRMLHVQSPSASRSRLCGAACLSAWWWTVSLWTDMHTHIHTVSVHEPWSGGTRTLQTVCFIFYSSDPFYVGHTHSWTFESFCCVKILIHPTWFWGFVESAVFHHHGNWCWPPHQNHHTQIWRSTCSPRFWQ